MMEKRIKLERIEKEEAFPCLAQLVFNEEVMGMNMGRVFTREEARGYFSSILEYNSANKNAGAYRVFLEDGHAFIGIGSLWVREDGAEVEYMVLPEYWRQGYAAEIVKTLIEIAKRDTAAKKVSGLIDPANFPSKKVLIKNGFAFERAIHVEEDDSTVEVYSITI